MHRTCALFPALLLLLTMVPVVRAEKEDARPSERLPGLKFKVFELKHRLPEDVMRVIRPLSSGVKGTSIMESNKFRTISLRDYPENIAAIEEALKRLDVPVPLRPDVELRLRVLIAAPTGPSNVASDLEPVVKELRATLKYKSYNEVVVPIVARARHGLSAKGKGAAQVVPPVTSEPSSMNYSFEFGEITVGGSQQVQVQKVFFWMGNKQLGEADVSTGLTIKEGEKVVVGTASLKERALILVLSARIVR